MKVLSLVVVVVALTLTTASAFQQVQPAFRPASALRISKEEDLELTRKLILDKMNVDTAAAPADVVEDAPPEPATEEEEVEEKKKPVAAAEE